MAQTKRKRRRKHRGTQSGRVDARGRTGGRPRSRAEARAQARRNQQAKREQPPTWRGAVTRGVVAALIFFAFLAFVFDRGTGEAAGLAGFMLVFYIPMGYYLDRFFYRRRMSQRAKQGDGGKKPGS